MTHFTTIRFGWLVAALSFAAAGCSGAGGAGENGGGSDFDPATCNWQDGLPDGSYVESCDGCAVEDGELGCICRDSAGNDVETTLALRQCEGDITNEDGILTQPGDDGAPTDGGGVETAAGTCDLRSVNQTCAEFEGDLAEIQAHEEDCVARGGVWSSAECPPAPDGNCCTYEGFVQQCAYTDDAFLGVFGACFSHNICGCG